MNQATLEFVNKLQQLKPGYLGLLRAHSFKDLDESVDCFDLFTGVWWPLRQKTPRAPQRDVAWLATKLYAHCPLKYEDGRYLASQLRICFYKAENEQKNTIRRKFDEMINLSIEKLEPSLQWALKLLYENSLTLDWVKLIDDLSIWERTETRNRWAEQFVSSNQNQSK